MKIRINLSTFDCTAGQDTKYLSFLDRAAVTDQIFHIPKRDNTLDVTNLVTNINLIESFV